MFVLVFWTETKTVSIVDEKDIIPMKEEGETTQVKYKDQRLYRAKIIKKSDDRDYLSYLRVTTDGEILRKNNVSSSLASEQNNMMKTQNKATKKRKQEAVNHTSKRIISSKPVFYSSDESEHATENSPGMLSTEEAPIIAESEPSTTSGDQLIAEKDQGSDVHEKNSDLASSVLENKGELETKLELSRKPGHGRVQLCEAYNVWIDKGELTYMQRWLHAPKELTRCLLKELVGVDSLKKMCARGRSKSRPGIPKEILASIEYYVNRKTTANTLKPAEFTNVVNFMCGTLRHPKPL